MTNPTPSSDTLSQLLYKLDPMNTCCVENECLNEYHRVAEGINERIDTGQSIAAAVHDAFIDWFEAAPDDSLTEEIRQFLHAAVKQPLSFD